MKTIKKTLALVLALCAVLMLTVPSVSAATPPNRLYNMLKAHADLLTQPLDNHTTKNLVKGYTISPHNDATADRTVKYVGQSAAKNVSFLKGYGLYSYQKAADVGYWVAIELTTVEVDKYLVEFNASINGLTSAGKFDVYVIPSFDYSAMNDAALKTAIDAKLVAANKLGTYDMKAGGLHSIGVVDFKAAGNYIVVMKLTGTATVDKHDETNANLHLQFINMTPSTAAANLTVTTTVSGGGNDQPPKTGYTLIAPVVACVLSGAAVVVCSKKKEN